MKTYLNLGCGNRYHKAWTNIDFISTSAEVIAHNLLDGIPFPDKYFEVVYHSHVLEHFTKQDGRLFLEECFRVLKPNGIIRIAVPDLEQIVREYLKNLELSLQGDVKAQQNYEWIMLEMYDQAVRSKSGGDIATYLYQPEIPNEEYVFSRLGEEVISLRKKYLESMNQPLSTVKLQNNKNALRKWLSKFKNLLTKPFHEGISELSQKNKKHLELSKFRLGGEIHQWMYDRYSLKKILSELGFKEIKVKTAFESDIPEWNTFELETKDKVIFKPDSLFIEGKK